MTDSIIVKPLTNLRTLLKNTTAFQTWVGHTGDTTKTNAHIFDHVILSEDVVRPFALITFGEDWRCELTAETNTFKDNGSIDVLFERAIDGTKDIDADMNIFANSVGDIISGMMALVGTGAYLCMTEITQVDKIACGNVKYKNIETSVFQWKFNIKWY